MYATVSTITTLRFDPEEPWGPLSRRWHSVEAFAAAAADAGFDSIGIDTVGATPPPPELAGLLRGHGLVCSDVAVLVINPAQVENTCPLDLAGRLRATVCVAVADETADPHGIVEAFRSAARRAEQQGVRLGVESRPFGYPATLSEARRLCRELGIERAGLVVDTWMLHHDDGARAELSDIQPEEIALVQLSDVAPSVAGDVREQARRHRCLPGHGVADLHGTLRVLDEIGWSGPVSMEVLSPAFGSRDLADQMARTRDAFDLCFQAPKRPRVHKEPA